MLIDITPKVEAANSFDTICMNLRGINALYIVRLANGKEFSVKWDEKQLEDFCRNRTVSEMLRSWEEGITAQHASAVNAYTTGIHPTWTNTKKVMDEWGKWTGRYKEVPYEMNTHERAVWMRESIHLKDQFGALTFSIILPEKDLVMSY